MDVLSCYLRIALIDTTLAACRCDSVVVTGIAIVVLIIIIPSVKDVQALFRHPLEWGDPV